MHYALPSQRAAELLGMYTYEKHIIHEPGAKRRDVYTQKGRDKRQGKRKKETSMRVHVHRRGREYKVHIDFHK